MRLRVKGKNIEVTASIREYAETKIGKLEKYLHRRPRGRGRALRGAEPVDPRAARRRGHRLPEGSTLRASESAIEMRIAIDRLHENLERQVRRYREKRRVEPRRHAEHHNTE